MNVRLMQRDDLDDVALLEEKYFSIPWSKDALSSSFELDSYVFVVAEEKFSDDKRAKAVAYCAMYQTGEDADITNVVVDEKYRNAGLGKEIIEFLLKEARKRLVKKIFLEVRKSNEAALCLYKKLGFDEIGLRKNFYEKPVEDAILMAKNI